MNICFFNGIIVTEPDFKFIISKNISFKECRHISISRFKLELDNETIITVKAYDELADYCFNNLKIGDFITISGIINDLFEVEILTFRDIQ